MYDGQIVFSQLMAFIPRRSFDTCVRRYHGNRRVRQFSCRDQFLCMAFTQLTYRESLRDIEVCLRAMGAKLYHAVLRLPEWLGNCRMNPAVSMCPQATLPQRTPPAKLAECNDPQSKNPTSTKKAHATSAAIHACSYN